MVSKASEIVVRLSAGRHAVETEPRIELSPRRKPGLRKRQGLLILALSAIVVGGVWGVYAWATAANTHVAGAEHGSRNGKASLGFVAADEASRSGDSAATRRETVPVEVVQRNHTLRVTGTMMADEKSAVVANVSGIVAEVRVDRGSVVRKGDLLVQLDPTDAKNKLAEGRALLEELKSRLGLGPEAMPQTFKAEEQPEVKLAGASLALAEANLKRADKLLSQRAMAAEAYEQTQTERELAVQRYDQAVRQMRQAFLACKTAQFRLAILEKAVADTAILAPFDGLVAEKLVSVGEQISSGMQATKVVTLVRIDPLRLSLTVPQNDVGHVRQGQKVRFQVDSFPDRTFEGTVRFISPVVTNDTRSLVVEAVVPNAEATLRPGLFATAQLVLAEQQAGIYVPAGAVQKMEEVARVFVVREGVAREQVVALGEQNPQKVEIKSGLSGKELLVARPDLVRDGDLVR